LLEEQFGYQNEDIHLLLNQEATRRNIIRKLYTLSEAIQEEDRILIYYSGHGYMNKRNKLGYWIPINAEKGFKADYIANSEIQDLIKSMDCRHMLLISDSCFSGSLLVRDAIEEEENAFDYWEDNPSRWIFCSGKGVVADGVKNENSPFAKQLLKHLSETQLDKININWLADKVIRSVRFGYEQQAEACPLYGAGHDGGQFIFYKKGTIENQEKAAYETAKQSTDIQTLIDFLETAKNKNYKRSIRKILRNLEQEEAWKKVNQNSYASLDEFIDEYPNSPYLKDAEVLKEALKQKKRKPKATKPSPPPIKKEPITKPKAKPKTKPVKKASGLKAIQDLIEDNDLFKAYDELEKYLDQSKGATKHFLKLKHLKESYADFLNLSRLGEYTYNTEVREKRKIVESSIQLLEQIQKTPKKQVKKIPQVKIFRNTYTDPRDGKTYQVVELKDGNIWLAQNLSFQLEEGCWAYKDSERNRSTYGNLYTWDAAMEACPPGWRIPNKAEWWELRKQYGGSKAAYAPLIDGGGAGFNALLGGYRDSYKSYNRLKEYGCFWSSTTVNKGKRVLGFDFRRHKKGDSIAQIERFKSVGRSVRCILDK